MSLARAAAPWDFPGGAEEMKEKQKKYGALGNKWYEDYEAALGLLKGKSPKAKEAIDRLRFAIRSKPASDAGAQNDQTRAPLPYFPYYYLAKAFYLDHDYPSSQKCLEKEANARGITGSSLAAEFNRLKADVDAIAAAGPLVADADKVLAWGEGQGEIALGAGAARSLPRIKQLRDQLADPKSADKSKATADLTVELAALLKGQLAERGAFLKDLAQEFPDAYAGKQDLVAPGLCQAPQGDRPAEAIAALTRCAGGITKAERRAGQSECDQLASLRDGIRSQTEAATRWTGSDRAAAPSDGTPDLPASCSGFKWSDAPDTQVHQELGRLRDQRQALRQRLREMTSALDQRISKRRDDYNRNVDEAAGLIQPLPPDCIATLGLELAQKKLEDRRQKLKAAKIAGNEAPALELLQPANQIVRSDLDAVAASVEAGVRDLVGRKSECEGVSQANLDALPGLLSSYKTGGARAGDLTALCGKARSAVADIDTCFEKNTGSVAEDVRGYLPLVRAAQAASPLECLSRSVAALSRVGGAPAANVGPWVRGAREAIRSAQSCIATLRGEAEGDWGEVGPRFTRVVDLLGGSSETPKGLDAGTARHIDRVRSEIREALPRLEKIAPLYGQTGDEVPQGADLRQALNDAGLAGRVDGGAWQLLEAAKTRDPRFYAEAWRALRDAASMAELDRVGGRLPEWERVAKNMGPFITLTRALDAFSSGDLDEAILALRTAQSRGVLPPAGMPAALTHASLAYFLHVKKQTMGSTDAARLMEQDIEKEARAAVRADAGIRQVWETIFKSESFGGYLQRVD